VQRLTSSWPRAEAAYRRLLVGKSACPRPQASGLAEIERVCETAGRAVRGPGDGSSRDQDAPGRACSLRRGAGRACTVAPHGDTRTWPTGSSCPPSWRGAARAAHPAGGELQSSPRSSRGAGELGRRPPHVEPLPDWMRAKFPWPGSSPTWIPTCSTWPAWSWCSSARPTTWRPSGNPPDARSERLDLLGDCAWTAASTRWPRPSTAVAVTRQFSALSFLRCSSRNRSTVDQARVSFAFL